MPIRIEQEHAQIGIINHRAKLVIESNRPMMKVVRRPAKMNITRQRPSFQVDWAEVRNRIFAHKQGSSFVIDLGHEASARGRRATEEIVQDGNRMGAIHLQGDPVADIARRKMVSDQPELNVNPVPQPLPEITWNPGSMTIDWEVHQLEIEWEGLGKPNIQVEPHSVEIFLRNRPSIKIFFIPDEPAAGLDAQI